MIDLIFNLIMPQNISVQFTNNPLSCGLTITVTKNGFSTTRTINKYPLERMDETELYNLIKHMVCLLLYEEQQRAVAIERIKESNMTIKLERNDYDN